MATTPAGTRRSAAPRTPRKNGSRGLTRDEIVAAAIRLSHADGFEGLSMRRLAEELDVTAMALYYHVKNKQDLFNLVTDSVLEQIEESPDSGGSWEERLAAVYRTGRAVLARHPGIGALLIDMDLTAVRRRNTTSVMRILLDAGFPEREARLARRALHMFDLGRLYIEDLPERSSASASRSARGSGAHPTSDEYFEFGLQTIIGGLKQQLAVSRKAQRAARRVNGDKVEKPAPQRAETRPATGRRTARP